MPERAYPRKRIPARTVDRVLRRVIEAGRAEDQAMIASWGRLAGRDDEETYVSNASPFALPSQTTFTARLRQAGRWESFDNPLTLVSALRTDWDAVALAYNKVLVGSLYFTLSSSEEMSEVGVEGGEEALHVWVFETIEASLLETPVGQTSTEAVRALRKGIPTLAKWLGGIAAALIVAAVTRWLGLY